MAEPELTDHQALFKQAGLKTTQARKLILNILESNPQRHFSAEEIYQILLSHSEPVGIATVYRILAQFEKAGLLIRHQFEGNTSLFELSGRNHHDHLICTNCGAIIEFTNEEIEKLQDEIADKQGFDLVDHALYIFAACRNSDSCARRKDR